MNLAELFSAVRAAGHFGRHRLEALYEKLLFARDIEERALAIVGWRRGAKRIYYGLGQEAGPVAVCDLLLRTDYLVPAYRGVAHVIGKGMAPERVLAELLARPGGPLEGLGNPGTFTDPGLGIMPNSDTLGGNFGAAVGLALAARRHDDGRVVAAFFGDGASTRSPFYGALNLSALWDLPIVWVCENNKYCLATRYERMSHTPIAEKARSFGLAVRRVDGNDAMRVALSARELIAEVRQTRKPALLELDTYRMARASPDGDTYWYKNEEEYEAWRKRDPIALFEQRLLALRLMTASGIMERKTRVREAVEAMAENILKRPPADAESARKHYGRFFPRPESAAALPVPAAPRRMRKVAEALRDALDEEMGKNPAIVLLGQDVGFYGGRRGVSQDLEARYGAGRVIDAPLNEELYAGIAIGAAQAGLRPVVEFSHAAFLLLAANDVHRLGFWDAVNLGKFSLPIVLRVQLGSGYDEYGEELALSPVSALLNWKGPRMVVPSNACQAKGLLTAALRENTPTILFEHRMLYADEGEVPDGDYQMPLSRGEIARRGGDITVLAYGYLTKLALEAAAKLEQEGTSVEVADLVSLVPLDRELILASAKKTGKVLILDEEPAHAAGLSAVLFTLIHSALPDVKVASLGAETLPLPFGVLAKFFLPDVEKIMNAVRGMLKTHSDEV